MTRFTRIFKWAAAHRNGLIFTGTIALATCIGAAWMASAMDHPFQQISFLSTWRAISVALTGAFGALGLLTEYRDKKRDRVTPWGRVALAGILASTILGVIAQVAESASEYRKTQQTVMDLKRLMTPLIDPAIYVTADAFCGEVFSEFCAAIQRDDPTAWQKWPYPTPPQLAVSVILFRDVQRADDAVKNPAKDMGYRLYFTVPHTWPSGVVVNAVPDPTRNRQVAFIFSGYVPPSIPPRNNEDLYSSLDVTVMDILVQPVGIVGGPAVPGLRPTYVSLQFRSARPIEAFSPAIKEVSTSAVGMYRAVLPIQSDLSQR